MIVMQELVENISRVTSTMRDIDIKNVTIDSKLIMMRGVFLVKADLQSHKSNYRQDDTKGWTLRRLRGVGDLV